MSVTIDVVVNIVTVLCRRLLVGRRENSWRQTRLVSVRSHDGDWEPERSPAQRLSAAAQETLDGIAEER